MGDEEVAAVAEALQYNTVCQVLRLPDNSRVTDRSIETLQTALAQSGVVTVALSKTSVSPERVAAVCSIFAVNAARRLKHIDTAVQAIHWAYTGVGNNEVEKLATGLRGNTVCRSVNLEADIGVCCADLVRMFEYSNRKIFECSNIRMKIYSNVRIFE